MANGIGQDDEVLVPIEELTLVEEETRKRLREESAAGAAGPVKDENGIADDTLRIPYRGADGGVVKPELRQHFAASEPEIARHEVAFYGSRMSGIRGRRMAKKAECEDGPGSQGMLNRFAHATIL
jgi:hypothetical protein